MLVELQSPLGTAPSGWQLKQVKQITTKVGSGATPRGGQSVYLPERENFALVRSQNVFDRYFSTEGLAYISNRDAQQLSNVWLQEGDILLNITGDGITFSRACIVPLDVLPACVNQHVSILRTDLDLCLPEYLLAYLTHPLVKQYIESFNAGGSRRAITKGHIESFVVPVPPLDEQQAIAVSLGSLDDKIELNRRMNATLEQMARAIFKSWFVDFDPVHVKARGEQPYGMDADTAALFPESFEESELGWIPAGWQLLALDEVANYQNGLALQKFPAEEGQDFLYRLKIRELRQGYFDEQSERSNPDIREDCIAYDGDVIFSWSGSLLIDIWTGGIGALNQHLFKVTSETFPRWFYYFWSKHHLDEFQRIAAGKATTMGHIQRHHLSEAIVYVPPEPLIARAHEVINPLIEALVNNRLESRTLAEFRDTLLPKLISGELRINYRLHSQTSS